VRQLLDLEPAWAKHDAFFVTEDTSLGRSLAETQRTAFVPHYAAGQARLGSPFRMLRAAIINFFRSAAIILRERPQVIVSTGAGAVFFAVVWARLTGARVVVVESFARFDRPSLFGRLAAPLAHDLIIQSGALAPSYPKAKIFDPLRMLDGPRPEKLPLLFATVGATLPFDRLTRSVAELKASNAISDDVLFQVGVGGVAPKVGRVREEIPFNEVQAILKKADVVVCHGGTGSLITALREGCRVVAMPRQAALGEHYDDHQSEITGAFAARGLIRVANTVEELDSAIKAAKASMPVMATTAPDGLIAHLNVIFDQVKK
jgi:UDP-N-acetylglucosamine transferase subunit ALG13